MNYLYIIPILIFNGLIVLLPVVIQKIFNNYKCLRNIRAINQNTKRILSFVFGLVIGDIFLHLMPASWFIYAVIRKINLFICGLWTIFGLLISVFFHNTISITFPWITIKNSHRKSKKSTNLNNSNNSKQSEVVCKKNISEIKPFGHLAVIVSALEAFFYGLMIGCAFVITGKAGILSTMILVVHQVPYQFRDFVLLMHSGFESHNTLICQYFSAIWRMLGSILAVIVGESFSIFIEIWLIPVIAGVFLYLTLGVLVPIITSEKSPKEAGYQMLWICMGIASAGSMSYLKRIIDVY